MTLLTAARLETHRGPPDEFSDGVRSTRHTHHPGAARPPATPGEHVSRMIFVNLPVSDLAASRSFFGALGFTFNEEFSDDKAACVVLADNIFVMLLRCDFFATFI